MNLSEIGKRIKLERKKQNLSQEKLAEKINVTPHYVYEIERGLKAMSLETLINISTVMGMSTDFILFGEQNNVSLYDQLDKMDANQRKNVENIFKKLLPYIR